MPAKTNRTPAPRKSARRPLVATSAARVSPARRTATLTRAAPRRTNGTTNGHRFAGVGDPAVLAATGKSWDQWHRLLDEAGAAQMDHSAIARYLHERCGVGDWWAQMVTVGYEQARGRRVKHQTPDGFQISASRVIGVGVPRLFSAWADEALRKRWLPGADLLVRTATPDKSMRITWRVLGTRPGGASGETSLEVNFYGRGTRKAQTTVQHGKLRDTGEAERMKAYWSDRLDALKKLLES